MYYDTHKRIIMCNKYFIIILSVLEISMKSILTTDFWAICMFVEKIYVLILSTYVDFNVSLEICSAMCYISNVIIHNYL